MAASLTDILTSAQNVASAINGLASTYMNVNGENVSTAITTATVVKSTPGRVCVVSVIVAGAAGKIYDATSASATTGAVYTVPATVGVVVVNIPTLLGIVVAPGAGQTVTVSFS